MPVKLSKADRDLVRERAGDICEIRDGQHSKTCYVVHVLDLPHHNDAPSNLLWACGRHIKEMGDPILVNRLDLLPQIGENRPVPLVPASSPADASDLIDLWKAKGGPRIDLGLGVTIVDLERYFASATARYTSERNGLIREDLNGKPK